jgi:hypothetical protein
MAESRNQSFIDEIDELAGRLKEAITDDNLNAISGLSTKLEEYWAFAVARLDRSALRYVDQQLFTVTSLGAFKVNRELTYQQSLAARLDRLRALRSATAYVLSMDLVGAADEDKAYLAQHRYDTMILELVHQNGIVRRADILDRLQQDHQFATVKNPSQTCSNHLWRLCREDFLLRAATGSYRLGVRGRNLFEHQQQSWLEKMTSLMSMIKATPARATHQLVNAAVEKDLITTDERLLATTIIGQLRNPKTVNGRGRKGAFTGATTEPARNPSLRSASVQAGG